MEDHQSFLLVFYLHISQESYRINMLWLELHGLSASFSKFCTSIIVEMGNKCGKQDAMQ